MFKAIKTSIVNAYKSAIRAVFGHEFTVWHHWEDKGKQKVKVFHCKTYSEALEVLSCGFNDGVNCIVDRKGYLVAERYAVKAC